MNSGKVTITIEGYGFHDAGGNGSPGVPSIKVTLLTADRADNDPAVPFHRVNWSVALDNKVPIRMVETKLDTSDRNKKMKWEIDLSLPSSRLTDPYAILIEEFETLLRDDTATLQERGPFFSHVVDIRRGVDPSFRSPT